MQVRLGAKRRGCHLVTSEVWTQRRCVFGRQLVSACLPLKQGGAAQVLKQVGGSLSDFRVGLCNIFCAPAFGYMALFTLLL